MRQNIELPVRLIPLKIRDHQRKQSEFAALLRERIAALQTRPEMRKDFINEMRRFLPAATVRETVEQESYWNFLSGVVEDLGRKALS